MVSAPTYRVARTEDGLWTVLSPSGISLGAYATVTAAEADAVLFRETADALRGVA